MIDLGYKTYEDVMKLFKEMPGYDEKNDELTVHIDVLSKQFIDQGLSEKDAKYYATSMVVNGQYEPGEVYTIQFDK